MCYAQNGDNTTEIEYGTNGYRCIKRDNAENTDYYIYDQSGRLQAEAAIVRVVLDGSVKTVMHPSYQYVWGSDKVLAQFDILNNEIYYYLYNGHCDVVQIVDTNGNIVNSYDYDVWGNFVTKNETIHNPFTYFGQTYDETTGLYYLRARYYDPATSRMLSEDTHWNVNNMIYGDYPDKDNPVPDIASMTQSTNLYVYAMNNPIRYFDPSGLVAGEQFSSSDEAAKDWAWNYYGASNYVGFECASIIYIDWDENGNIFYSYTYGVWGEPHSVTPGDAMKFVPDSSVAFSVIHSHPNNPNFSLADMEYATSRSWSIYVVTKASNGVNIKKWADTRQGYKESTIVTIQAIAQLSSERKQDLKNKFQAKWNAHVKNGCTQGFKCEHKKWPRT